MTESVVGGQRKPALAAKLDHGSCDACGQRMGVIGPVNSVRRTGFSGQVGRRSAGHQKRSVFLLHDVSHGKRNSGVRCIDHRIDPVTIKPFPCDIGAGVGLVHMVAADHLNRPLHLVRRREKIFHCHLCGDNRPWPGDVGVKPDIVRQYAKTQGGGVLGARADSGPAPRQYSQSDEQRSPPRQFSDQHVRLPSFVRRKAEAPKPVSFPRTNRPRIDLARIFFFAGRATRLTASSASSDVGPRLRSRRHRRPIP